jgi:hypothetical protein
LWPTFCDGNQLSGTPEINDKTDGHIVLINGKTNAVMSELTADGFTKMLGGVKVAGYKPPPNEPRD